MRIIYIKIYVYALYVFYILPKAVINFILKRDVLKLKLGKYDSLLSDYDNNTSKKVDTKTSRNFTGKNSQETPDDKYPLW